MEILQEMSTLLQAGRAKKVVELVKQALADGIAPQVIMEEGEGYTFEVPDANTIIVNGIDKQIVGQIAAEVRSKRPPEPYKGKGIRYDGEYIRRKAGKAGKGK
jgi:large subunit ribosomal protein L6